MKIKNMFKKIGNFLLTILSMIVLPIVVIVCVFYFLFSVIA